MSAAKKRAIFYRMDENVLAVLSLLTKGFFAVQTRFGLIAPAWLPRLKKMLLPKTWYDCSNSANFGSTFIVL